jgi:hypothetical protein
MNNFLKLGTMGVGSLIAAILLGTGELLYGAILILAVILFFFFWPKPKLRKDHGRIWNQGYHGEIISPASPLLAE